MPMSVDSQSQARTIDGHSTAEYLRHLDAHVSEYESTLEKTKEMYKRIGELQQSPTKVSGGSPIRIHAEMATPSMCPGAHCNEYRFLAERLVPAALKEFSRRYRILAPMKGPLKLPRHCKAVLPSGSCTEVCVSRKILYNKTKRRQQCEFELAASQGSRLHLLVFFDCEETGDSP